MKIATTTADFESCTKSQLEAMQYISEAGFVYLDYNFDTDYGRHDGAYSKNYKDYMESVKIRANELGVKFVQAHAPMGKPINDDNGDFIRTTIRSIEAASMLDIPNIVVHLGYKLGLSKKENFEENKKFFEALFDSAEKYDVNILVENFNKMSIENMYWIDNAHDLYDFIKYVNHPRLHAVWDTGHGNMQELSQNEAVELLGEELYALHVQDNNGISDLHMAPLFGTTNYDSLMHGLKNIGYNGYFTLEGCNIFLPHRKKRQFELDNRLANPSLELKKHGEKILYEIAKSILIAYDCFEK